MHADNVGSKQFQDIRRVRAALACCTRCCCLPAPPTSFGLSQGLRPSSTVLMGKNTLMKRCIRLYVERTGNEQWNTLLDALVGNVGLVFTKGDLNDVRIFEQV